MLQNVASDQGLLFCSEMVFKFKEKFDVQIFSARMFFLWNGYASKWNNSGTETFTFFIGGYS